MLILVKVGFQCQVMLPYGHLINYIQALEIKDKDFSQTAWNYLNDAYACFIFEVMHSFKTRLFVLYQPHIIACAAIYLTAREKMVPLPLEWFVVFDAIESDLVNVSQEILLVIKRAEEKSYMDLLLIVDIPDPE